ncbi:flagellin [Alkalihalobacillus sp. MEB130]|uniref:flagellin n=1 Tax=Alkalihalobacillus sp. MEB130 TaxID=2976704 RepID=UPI0028DF09C0|nr:flagellin [Alkalihalobacillus sp. MEB130]MDT8858771.1 flagellin [Alkalihalobacillus sp. MEB130]
MIISGTYLSSMLNNKTKQTQNNLQQAIERVSSGKRINRAADDAAGLAIVKKMQAQIRGSQQASRNVQDAQSLVQTAEGGMEEITSIIQRIRELSVQASNDTLTYGDRMAVQDEIDQLIREKNNIVVNTEFNQKKLLTNTNPGDYLYENRIASKTSQMSVTGHSLPVATGMNNVGYSTLNQTIVPSNQNVVVSPASQTTYGFPESYIGSTVVDHLPRWTLDGQSIVFRSSRDGGDYIVPANASSDPVVSTSPPTASQKTVTDNSLMRLEHSGSSLYLQARSSTSHGWSTIQTYHNYNRNDGNNGYSFSPIVDANGNSSFVYSDNEGNLLRVDVNIHSQTVMNPSGVDLISSTDVLNIPPINNTVTLPSTPDLYRMNESDASLRIQKVNDNGSRELTYWNGEGDPPTTGYYTISGNTVTFYGDAIIGSESVDDAQDFYRFSYVSDGVQDAIHTVAIPSLAEVYNMHGEEGPRSLNIFVGGTNVTADQLLATRPAADEVETTHGVYVNRETGRIEFYGDLRPSYSQLVTVQYRNDVDGRNDVFTFHLQSGIDTYNLENPDIDLNRALRVFIQANGEERELEYSEINGYTYNRENGQISLHGDARPDLPSNTTIRVEYVVDASSSNTTREVYGIPLGSLRPELYNVENEEEPKSIRVYRNSNEEISFSETDGFVYNQSTNTIELYGTARPDTGDTYSVQMIRAVGGITFQDELVEVQLFHTPETYGMADPTIPSTFRVIVDGEEIYYDPFQLEGFYYNSETNRIEIYGDSRPDAGHSSNPDIQVYYVYESPSDWE